MAFISSPQALLARQRTVEQSIADDERQLRALQQLTLAK
jgi:hypothetical protein